MLQIIPAASQLDHGFISILYPGTAVSTAGADSGVGSIGRVDHAYVKGDTFIRMHPHVNDEILSYFRTGQCEHKDSTGIAETIGGRKLMLMKAGKLFHHEERILGHAEPMEGLQIFIRPGQKDLTPEVMFLELETLHSDNRWRLLASPTRETVFQFSSRTWIYDMKLRAGHVSALPEQPAPGLTGLLYVFKGAATANGSIALRKKDGLLFRDEPISIAADEGAELVLFLTDENAKIYKGGMFSGDQSKS